MAARAVSTADVGSEGYGEKLAASIKYRVRRALAQGPQDERYIGTRLYGFGVPKKTQAELMAEMDLTAEQFEELRQRADERIAAVLRGR